MLETSDADRTREAFAALKLDFEEHDPLEGMTPDSMSVSDVQRGRAERPARS
jgi:hypothetical protein